MSTFRYSTISDAYKCYKYYELKHVLGLKDNSDKNADLKFGTALHLAIQDMFEGGNGIDVFNIFWNAEEKNSLVYGRLPHGVLNDIGNTLLERFERLHLKHFNMAHIEKKMEVALGDYKLTGTVDFIGEYKGVPSVVDWKTGGYPYEKEKLIINEQMYGYNAMARASLGYQAKQHVYVVFVKNPKEPRIQVLTKEVTDDKMNNMLDNVHTMCNEITNRTVFPKNRNNCMMGKYKCSFFNTCYGEDNE